jgi:hypothetical protein
MKARWALEPNLRERASLTVILINFDGFTKTPFFKKQEFPGTNFFWGF